MTPHHNDNNNDDDGDGPDAEAAVQQAALRRMRAARYWIATHCPYYMTVLFRCPLRTTNHVATVVIDRHWRIWANPANINTLTVKQTAVELMHVLNHALRGHHQRAQHTIADPFLALAWNAAADCEINDDLLDGLPYKTAELPDHWLTPWKLHMGDSQTAETYYRRILGGDRIDPDTGAVAWLDQGSGDVHRHSNDCGSAATGITPHRPPTPPATHKHACCADEQPNTPSTTTNKTPTPSPKYSCDGPTNSSTPKSTGAELSAAALRRAAHHRTGDNDYTWTRPPRRPNPHTPHGEILRPATSRPIPDLAVIMDTSGSMDPDDHNTAIAEIDAICTRVTPGHHIDYYAVDTKTRARQRITNTRQLPLHGGGGTDMAAGINTAAQTKPTAIIVLTDGHTPWPDQPPPGRPTTIAVLIGDAAPTLDIPHWIQTIHIN